MLDAKTGVMLPRARG